MCPVAHTVETGDADRVVAYERTDGDETLVVVLHFGDGTAKVSLDTIDEETDLLSGNPVGGDGTVEVGDTPSGIGHDTSDSARFHDRTDSARTSMKNPIKVLR